MICFDAGSFFDASAWVTGTGLFVSLLFLAACFLTRTRDSSGECIGGSGDWKIGFGLGAVAVFVVTAAFVFHERDSIRKHQADMAIRGLTQSGNAAK